ncbi:hypothetical protein [Deinococcus radiotolerans]|uniref:OmpR/PhoB-type domain-containing protein n=1 Tax=Deinococcus radiotolerans TaxID=1309407 RepID=A0ABQ2FHY8_9DEIO|nr:hypothetical protein [Deinococcus radiotolerans]GGK99660.1 hypothetical protein GCM10010844_17460 [Deinococcus radiotolerans]
MPDLSRTSAFTLHVLGHTYLSAAGAPLPVSAKGVALLTYLTLEGRPFHREHLADRLWQSADALRNLRVELNRLRRALPGLIPDRQPMLTLSVPTDLTDWMQRADTLTPAEVGAWLSVGTGVPLSGLEDLGSPAFRAWVDSQRWRVTQAIEAQLGATYTRLRRAGEGTAAALIADRAEHLGWTLPPAPHPARSAPLLGGPQRPALDALEAARHRPQVALLSGRGPQARRDLAEELAQGDWRTVHVTCPPDPELLMGAFLHQLGALAGQNPDVQALLHAPDATSRHVVQLWTLYTQLQRPLIVVVHEISDPALILPHVQVALNLPAELLLVLCPASPAARRALRAALGTVDPSRQVELHLPPLGIHDLLEALPAQPDLNTDDRRYAQAARIAMDADGWEPLAQHLLDHPDPDGLRPSLPPQLRGARLAELAGLPGPFRAALARLAVAHEPLTAALADALGVDEPGVLAQAEQLGLLLPCEPVETVTLPGLDYRCPDHSRTLGFASEALRVALASTLTRSERQDMRRRLALAAAGDTPLAAHYARQAGEEAPPGAQQAGRVVVPGRPGPMTPPAAPLPGPETPQRACRTGSGYRVTVAGPTVQVLRRGLYGRPVTLRLAWGPLPAGPWQLTVRVDALRAGPDLGPGETPYALSWRTDREEIIVGTAPTWHVAPDAGPVTYYRAQPGQWMTLSGQNAAGVPELRVRAVDVALTFMMTTPLDSPARVRTRG